MKHKKRTLKVVYSYRLASDPDMRIVRTAKLVRYDGQGDCDLMYIARLIYKHIGKHHLAWGSVYRESMCQIKVENIESDDTRDWSYLDEVSTWPGSKMQRVYSPRTHQIIPPIQ